MMAEHKQNCPKDARSKCAQNSVKARKVAAYELCGENVPVKSSCPKDADTTRTNDVVSKRCCPYLLRAGKGRYFKCTRINFHKGKHHAHDEGGKCLAVWGG